MMFPNQAEYVAEERRKEIERELRRAHMFKSLPRRQAWWSLVLRKSVNWVGVQMVQVGTRLQSPLLTGQVLASVATNSDSCLGKEC